MSSSSSSSLALLDRRRDRYPICLVWGPLPVITWLLPFIGHLGVADSEGKIHDFAGPYTIGIDRFMVSVTRYLPIEIAAHGVTPAQWDAAIDSSDGCYSERVHNICCQNCHHHVSDAMRELGIAGLDSQFKCAATMLLKGRFKSRGALLQTYAPFAVIVTIILLAVLLTR